MCNHKRCNDAGISTHRVGDIYDVDKDGQPIPNENLVKWFVAAPAGQFDKEIEGIPLSLTESEAESLAVKHLQLN